MPRRDGRGRWLLGLGLLLLPARLDALDAPVQPAQPPAAATATQAADPATDLALELRADRPATWFWLLNALAGDPRVETAAFRAWWGQGQPLAADDEAMLRRFQRIRDARRPLAASHGRQNPYVPVPPPASLRPEVRFAGLFLHSRTLAEVQARADAQLPADDAATLRAVLAHFGPRLEARWQEMAHLDRFRAAFARWSAGAGLSAFLRQAQRFYGARQPESPRVHFVPAPPGQVLHGRRLGADVVVEVRPDDTPARRSDVVVHELCHHLHEAGAIDDDPALLGVFFGGDDRAGPRAWALLNEGLATALGQGAWLARVDPDGFAKSRTQPRSWYVDDAIDPFAKAVFPVVQAALTGGRTLRDVAAELLRATSGPAGAPASVRDHLRWHVLVTRADADEVADAWYAAGPGGASWRVRLEEAAAMLDRFRAVSAVVAVTPADLAALPAAERKALVGDLPAAAQRPDACGVVARPRGGVGHVFVVVAADQARLARAVVALLALPRVSARWQPLRF